MKRPTEKGMMMAFLAVVFTLAAYTAFIKDYKFTFFLLVTAFCAFGTYFIAYGPHKKLEKPNTEDPTP